MVKYWRDAGQFVERLESGYFIQHTLENVLDDVDGKQLLCEAYYLFGSMLILMEARVPGAVRERLVIAAYRSQPALDLVDDVCRLVRRCSSVEQLFARATTPASKKTARNLISRLSSDDVYLMSSAFPDPSTRSIRLGAQASMIYACLYFDADTLKNKSTMMRQIVDRLFSDNWIIPVYMGHLVDLRVEWKSYPAAARALELADNAKGLSEANEEKVDAALAMLETYLTEGQLTEQHLLDNVKNLLDCCRESNAALRWRLLHERPSDKAIALLLKVAQLEYKLKQMFAALLETKNEKWQFCRQQVVDRMTELSDYFTGEKALARVRRDENLTRWFKQLAVEAETLVQDEATMTGRKIQNLISALEEVEQFEQVDSIQIKSFLADSREFLVQMVRLTNVQSTNVLETVADLSYAWEVLRQYVGILRDRIRADPSTAVLLRATFLKLASILDVPLVRISQCDSISSRGDQASVAEYYSRELVKFVRDVLDVIPRSVFQLLNEIIQIQTRLTPLPVKFETAYLKDFAQLGERYQLAKLTNQVSVFTEGVLAMEQTLLGVIRVEPRRILHDGLRKELVRRLCLALDLDATRGFERALDDLAHRIDGFRRSVEYVQDYIDIAGLKMWQEEFSRVINYAVENEANKYLRRKVLDSESKYQSSIVPIPPLRTNFMGSTLAALLRLTAPADTTYSPRAAAWHASSSGARVCGPVTFQAIERALGVAGLVGLDRLLGLKIVHELARLVESFPTAIKPLRGLVQTLRETPPSQPIAEKAYAQTAKKFDKLVSAEIFNRARSIGHYQLLRFGVKHALSLRSRLDANGLYQALAAVDAALLGDIHDACSPPPPPGEEKNEYPVNEKRDPDLLAHLAALLDASGFSHPFQKIYLKTDPLHGLPEALLMLVLTYAPKLDFDAKLGTLAKRKPSFPIDGFVLVVGIHTILKQFHPAYARSLLSYLSQFVSSTTQAYHHLDNAPSNNASHHHHHHHHHHHNGADRQLPLELTNTVWFLEHLSRVANVHSPTDLIPPEIRPPHGP
ncbi:hypothetical protein CTAYLR_009190 [Chrysophaeum taylorii]|uniref:WASH complex subunit strumpellin n=1 Tax=Chrysophaeum taylorii TaxID=2483200 RepID=A0AAD7XME2_9STRA|nr:hypothetical protein CTAYLR_009190 [Chrysophaeum taylorii]